MAPRCWERAPSTTSNSAVSRFLRHGCFTPETGHWLARLAHPKSANMYVWPGRAVQDGLPRSTNVRAASMYQASDVERFCSRPSWVSARIRDSLSERPRRANLAPSLMVAPGMELGPNMIIISILTSLEATAKSCSCVSAWRKNAGGGYEGIRPVLR
jgi:hypothetical protein